MWLSGVYRTGLGVVIGTLAQGKRGDSRWEIGDATLMHEWRPENIRNKETERGKTSVARKQEILLKPLAKLKSSNNNSA